MRWLIFALMTVVSWGLYGVFLHKGQGLMADPELGRYKAFFFVGIAYLLTAVIGSGIMGSRIACHFANIGVKVLLLDISPNDLSESEKKKGLSLTDKIVRNRIVTESFFTTLKTKPSSLYLNKKVEQEVL